MNPALAANRVSRRWAALLVMAALALAALGIWQGDRLTRQWLQPEYTDSLREIGQTIASDLGRAQQLGIPLDELVGVEPWFATQVDGSQLLSGLALTLPSGQLLAQHGLASDALAAVTTPPQTAQALHTTRPWVTLAIDRPDGSGPAGWLHLVGEPPALLLPQVLASLGGGLLAAALAAWGLHRWLRSRLALPLARIARQLVELESGTPPQAAPAHTTPTGPATDEVAWLERSVADQVEHLRQGQAALLQKLNEVRAAHFDRVVLARIDALAAPLLARVEHTTAQASRPPSTWAGFSLNRRVATVLLLGGVVVLGSAMALLWSQSQGLRDTLVDAETRRVQQSLSAALTLDQARAEPVIHVLTVQALLSGHAPQVVPLLPPDSQLWVRVGDQMASVTNPVDAPLATPEPGTLEGLLPQAPPVRGIWNATDHSLQSGAAKALVLPDGNVATAVLAQPLATTLARVARDLGAEVALADHRGQALGNDPQHWVDRWRLAGQVASWHGPDGNRLLLAVPLNSHSGHTLGQLVVTLPPNASAALQPQGLQLLAVVAMLSALGLAIGGVLQQLRPLADAADDLSRLAETQNAAADTTPTTVQLSALTRDIERVEHRLDMLRALRRSRERQGRRQARFIRHQMMNLAERLDEAARRSILEDLHRIEQAGQPDHVPTASSGPPADTRFERMVDDVGVLALGFQNLVDRVGDQYQQLGMLVKELRDALRVKTQFIALQQELEIARKMQQSILPHHFADQAGVTLHGDMQAAREVGGDFYDFFRLDPDHLALVVADVSGKGVPAAFFMAVSRTLLRAIAQFSRGPADCLWRLNDLLAADNEEMMFVTVFYAVIDTRNGQVVYGNAGHNPPYVLRADGRLEPVAGTGDMALAVMEGMPYHERPLQLHPGDALFMYTDGVTEASGADQALFGEDRLEAFLADKHGMAMHQVNSELFASIKAFEEGRAQTDDITCLMVRFEPTPGPTTT